jgi:hypothetical protein
MRGCGMTFHSIHRPILVALACASALATSAAHGQSADRGTAIANQSREAIVRITVEDPSPDEPNKRKTRHGTGFIARSADGQTYILTARHVIGSSSLKPDNPDWRVSEEKIQRTIKIERFNKYGEPKLIQIEPTVFGDDPTPNNDIVLLLLRASGYKTLPMVDENAGPNVEQEVVLLGFEDGKPYFRSPLPIGRIAFQNALYSTNFIFEPGESGGPLIDLKTGKVVAIASKSIVGNNYLAIPITYIFPAWTKLSPKDPDKTAALIEQDGYGQARGDREKLFKYVRECRICEYKEQALKEISALDRAAEQERRERDDELAYRRAGQDGQKLRDYLKSCDPICRFKQAASEAIDAIASRDDETEYRSARGDLQKLKNYASGCKDPCAFKGQAESEIRGIEANTKRSEDAKREAALYNTARGDRAALQTYIANCTLCEFKDAASREISSLERLKKTADEEIQYREARGNVEKTKAYAASCVVCAFKQAALSEVSSYDENRKREELAKQEASDYRMARGNRAKLEKYIADCSARKCEFKEAARSELESIAQRDCDREMAAQFDKDVPASIAFVPDTSALSDADVDKAIVACDAVRKTSGLSGPYRRFTTQAGRAYSARAARRAAGGKVAEARSDMNQAVALWNSAMQYGSGAAMNFLGAYAKGTFNNTSVTYGDADFSKALDYWLKGAATGNLKSMRNAGGMLLEGPDTFPGVKQDIARGRELLATAAAQGEMTAAAALGAALFYGSPSAIGKDQSRGLALLKKACAAGDKNAASTFDTIMKIAKYRSLVPTRPPGCDSEVQTPEIASRPAAPEKSGITFWSMEKSILSLEANGLKRKVYYYTPGSEEAGVGVKRGTLFFEGRRAGLEYTGSAYAFHKSCGPIGYAVTGVVSEDEKSVKFSGKIPQRGPKCEIVGYKEMSTTIIFRKPDVVASNDPTAK